MKPQRKTRLSSGFSMVELVIVILIIAVLAVAIFAGSSIAVEKSRDKRVTSDFHNFDVGAENYLYSNQQFQNGATLTTLAAQQEAILDLNPFLSANYAFDTSVQAPATGDICNTDASLYAFPSAKMDPWGNPYYVIIDNQSRNLNETETYLTVFSAGKNGKADMGGALDKDDQFLLLQFMNGEVISKTYSMKESPKDAAGKTLTAGQTRLSSASGVAPINRTAVTLAAGGNQPSGGSGSGSSGGTTPSKPSDGGSSKPSDSGKVTLDPDTPATIKKGTTTVVIDGKESTVDIPAGTVVAIDKDGSSVEATSPESTVPETPKNLPAEETKAPTLISFTIGAMETSTTYTPGTYETVSYEDVVAKVEPIYPVSYLTGMKGHWARNAKTGEITTATLSETELLESIDTHTSTYIAYTLNGGESASFNGVPAQVIAYACIENASDDTIANAEYLAAYLAHVSEKNAKYSVAKWNGTKYQKENSDSKIVSITEFGKTTTTTVKKVKKVEITAPSTSSKNVYVPQNVLFAEDGMTWAQWEASVYNTGGLAIGSIKDKNGNKVSTSSKITSGSEYVVETKQIPTMLSEFSWYKGTLAEWKVTKIVFSDKTAPSTYNEGWNADAENTGEIKCYRAGTVITIVGNGSGKIKANSDSHEMFCGENRGGIKGTFMSLKSIENLTLLDTSDVVDMSRMFAYCGAVETFDVSSFDTSKVTNMEEMFYNCYSAKTIYASNGWYTKNVTNSNNMFSGDTNLKGDISYDSSVIDKTYAVTNDGYLTFKEYSFGQISFTIEGVTYTARKGMTFGEWLNSTYSQQFGGDIVYECEHCGNTITLKFIRDDAYYYDDPNFENDTHSAGYLQPHFGGPELGMISPDTELTNGMTLELDVSCYA